MVAATAKAGRGASALVVRLALSRAAGAAEADDCVAELDLRVRAAGAIESLVESVVSGLSVRFLGISLPS